MEKVECAQEPEKKSDASNKTTEHKTSRSPQMFASLTVALGGLLVGFASAYTAPALASMSADKKLKQPTLEQKTWIGSLLPLFAAVGGIMGGPLIARLGRKCTLVITGFPFIVSFLLIAFAQDVALIMVGRGLMGLTVGISSLVSPVYLGETIEAKYRGVLGLIPTTLGNIGVLLSYTAGMFLNWSNLAFLGAVLPVPFLICTFIIPETPRWYASKGQLKKSAEALQWLRGNEDISNEFNEIEENLKKTENQKDKVSRVGYIKPILIIICLMFFQQMSGINAVIFYSVEIFMESGSNMNSNLQSIILGVVNVITSTASTLLIDRVGRKILLYCSGVTMSITLLCLGLYFMSKRLQDVATDELHSLEWLISQFNYAWMPLVCLLVYIIGFSLGFGPIPWLMMGEILPAKIKGSGASIATTFNWICSFLVTKFFPPLTVILGSHKTYWLFSVICFSAVIFVKLFVPETKGKSLEQIERQYTSKDKKEDSKNKELTNSERAKGSNGIVNLNFLVDYQTSSSDLELSDLELKKVNRNQSLILKTNAGDKKEELENKQMEKKDTYHHLCAPIIVNNVGFHNKEINTQQNQQGNSVTKENSVHFNN